MAFICVTSGSDIMPQGDFMTINLYHMIYCTTFWKAISFKQLHWCGKKLLLCHSKISNIYRTISLTDTSNNIIRSNDNNDDEEEDISLGDKTEYNKRR